MQTNVSVNVSMPVETYVNLVQAIAAAPLDKTGRRSTVASRIRDLIDAGLPPTPVVPVPSGNGVAVAGPAVATKEEIANESADLFSVAEPGPLPVLPGKQKKAK